MWGAVSDVVYPSGAPRIASDFHSLVGINGEHRGAPHQSIDITGNNGQPILAAADSKVLEATDEHCWGTTIAVDHGKNNDGNEIIALYGHLGEMLVGAGEQIKRGDVIARLGKNQYDYECIAGVRHLHFQIGREYRDQYDKGEYWGWAYFLEDGDRGVNPHLYWAGGRGEVTCFEPNQTYKPGSLTYPVPCQLLTPYHNEVRPTVFTCPLLSFQSYLSLLH